MFTLDLAMGPRQLPGGLGAQHRANSEPRTVAARPEAGP